MKTPRSDIHMIGVPPALTDYAYDRMIRYLNSTCDTAKISWSRDEVIKLTASCFIAGWLDWALAQTGRVSPDIPTG